MNNKKQALNHLGLPPSTPKKVIENTIWKRYYEVEHCLLNNESDFLSTKINKEKELLLKASQLIFPKKKFTLDQMPTHVKPKAWSKELDLPYNIHEEQLQKVRKKFKNIKYALFVTIALVLYFGWVNISNLGNLKKFEKYSSNVHIMKINSDSKEQITITAIECWKYDSKGNLFYLKEDLEKFNPARKPKKNEEMFWIIEPDGQIDIFNSSSSAGYAEEKRPAFLCMTIYYKLGIGRNSEIKSEDFVAHEVPDGIIRLEPKKSISLIAPK